MSNARAHRRRLRRPPTVDRSTAQAAAALSCAVHGCACAPDVELRHDHLGARITVRHDHWCPMHPDNRKAHP